MNGKSTTRKIRLPVKTSAMLLGVFILVAVSSIFIYAAGEEVLNNPNMAMISHTEYRFDEPGQIIARLVDFQGTPVTVTNCTATILFPDKTKFVDEELMVDSVNITGDHYFNFTTPVAGPEGVYEYQATCNYGPGGSFSQAVTNSFHLSSAFNSIFGNLTDIQTNLTLISVQISDVNASLAAEINTLSVNMGNNFTETFTRLTEINNTLTSEFSDIQANFTQVLTAIGLINFTAEFEDIQANLSVILSNQAAMNITIEDTNTVVNAMSIVLDEVNVTTTNTFEFVTGTLATNVNQILTDLGIINATVNRIETNTLEINSTTQSILANQEAEVVMSTFSG